MLQIYIAREETKFGLSATEATELLATETFQKFKNIFITGVMGIATNTHSESQIQQEFKFLKNTFAELKQTYFPDSPDFKEVSMGMSSDYNVAIAEGSTLIRVGSSIFGARNYAG